MQACASPVGAEDAEDTGGAGVAGGAGGACWRNIGKGEFPHPFKKNIIESFRKVFGAKKNLKILRHSQKSTKALEPYIALLPFIAGKQVLQIDCWKFIAGN